jgi:hypothetical protein
VQRPLHMANSYKLPDDIIRDLDQALAAVGL